ncbi:MAG: Hint domain-containing protein [Paracoccaceae bacterium]
MADDTHFGGPGDDTIDAGSSTDLVYGGAGNDSLDGGTNRDTVYGGDGNDSIDGGSADDTIYGGAGNDIIAGGSGDNIYHFEDGFGDDTLVDFNDNDDIIQVSSKGISNFTDVAARLTQVGPDSILTLDDGSTLTIENIGLGDLSAADFNILPPPVCFMAGTRIRTPNGDREVEHLSVGDLVETLDEGPQKIRWIGTQLITFKGRLSKHKPIQIKQGALGNGLPRRNLALSPQHRILAEGPAVRRLFGEDKVLALAKGIVKLPGVRQMKGRRNVTYFTLMLDSHQILISEGAYAESFYPGPTALNMLRRDQRIQIEALLPRLQEDPDTGYGQTVRRALTRSETENLVSLMLGESAELPRRSVGLQHVHRKEATRSSSLRLVVQEIETC